MSIPISDFNWMNSEGLNYDIKLTNERPDMIAYCGNDSCKYCYKDYRGALICAAPGYPALAPTSKDTHPNIIICHTYQKRESAVVPELQPGRTKDGLYPGQYRRSNG